MGAVMNARRKRRRILGYRAALHWLLDNDDTTFLDEEDGAISTTAVFLADCYGRSDDEVLRDLNRERARS